MVFYFRVATFMTTYRKCYSCKGPDASIGQTNRQTNVGSWTSPPLHPLPAGCPGLWPLVSNSWDQFCGIPQPDVRHVRPHSCGRRPRSRHPFPCCPRLAHHCQTVHDPEEGDWKAKKILANYSHLLNYISHVIVALKYSGGWWGIPVDQRPNSPPLVETGDIVDNISWTEDDDEDFSCEHCQNQKCSPGMVGLDMYPMYPQLLF